MSREQDQRLVYLYEKIVREENLKVGDKLLYTGENKQLKGKKGTITEVNKGLIKVFFDHINRAITVETPLIKKAWKLDESQYTDDDWAVLDTDTGKVVKYVKNPKNNKAPKGAYNASNQEIVRIGYGKKRGLIKESYGQIIGAPLSRRREAQPTQEGSMKELAMDLFDDIKGIEKTVGDMAKKIKSIAPAVFKHLNEALKHLNMAKSSLPVSEAKEGK